MIDKAPRRIACVLLGILLAGCLSNDPVDDDSELVEVADDALQVVTPTDLDTFVDSARPTTTFAGATRLDVVGSPATKRALLRFTVSNVPAGARVTGVTLRMYVSDRSNAAADVHAVNGAFSAATTYANAPSVGSRVASLPNPASSGVWTTADLTSVVTSNGSYSFYVLTSSADSMGFASEEAGTYKPRLVVAYEMPTAPTTVACQPALDGPADQASTFSPFPNLLFSTGTCAPADRAWYHVQIATSQTFETLIEDDHAYVGRHVHAGGLSAGTYWWRVRASTNDGRVSNWSTARSVTVTAPSRTLDVAAGATRTQLQSILDSAKSQPRTVVRLAKGATYTIAGCPTGGACLSMSAAREVMLDGNGAHFVVQSPTAGFMYLDSAREVTLKDFDIDYDPLPYSQLVVRSINSTAGTFVADVLPGMPALDAPHMQYEPDADYRKWAKMLDPNAPGKMSSHARGMYNVPFSSITNLGAGSYRVANTTAAREARIGDIFHKQARVNGSSNFSAGNSQLTALQNIVTYASPGSFVSAPRGYGLVITGCKVTVKPGRYASTDADLVHAPGMTLGPWVENNVFWGAMDDYVNLRPERLSIVARTDRSVTIAGGKVAAGDRVGLQDQSTGSAWARNVLSTDSTGTVLALDGSPGTATYAYPYSGAAPKTLFRYNSMLGGQRYGVLARIRESVFEGNVFDRTGSSAFAFENHPWWSSPEGLGSEDVLIVNNELRSIPAGAGGALWMAIMKQDHTVATGARILDRIRIVGNDFLDWSGSAIHMNHGVSSDIRCNRITSSLATPLGSSPTAIRVNDSNDVRVFDNRIDDPRTGYTPVSVTASDGVTTGRNGPTADTTACRIAASARGATSAPVWP